MDTQPAWQPYRRPEPPKRRHLWRYAALLAVVAFAVHLVLAHQSYQAEAKRSAGVTNLSQQIAQIMAANPNVTVGVSLIDLTTKQQTNYGSTKAVIAASTTKLVTALDFLHQVEHGNYSLSGQLGDETAGWQLQQLINQSNDDSWAAFINLMGGSQIQAYAQSIGLDSFNFQTNSIAPADEAVMLEKLDQGDLLNAADTRLLMSYMQHTNDDSLIPAALPAGAVVYHKYGELLEDSGNYVNDAAIITNKGRTYILTIYTDRTDELDIIGRDLLIHQITGDVVDYEASR